MRVEFNKEGNYNSWASAMWKEEFSYPINNIPELIGVSLSWIKRVLLKDIHYVVYDNKWLYKRSKNTCLTYIKKDDLNKWIMEHATYEIQTEIIDLAYYLKSYPKQLKECERLYKKGLASYKNRGFIVGTMPLKVLQYINSEFIINFRPVNYSSRARKKVDWVEIEPFDLFDHLDRIYYVGDKSHSSDSVETIYRNAFLQGDVKIKIGERITLFYKTNPHADSMKLPYLVPYDMGIKIYKV